MAHIYTLCRSTAGFLRLVSLSVSLSTELVSFALKKCGVLLRSYTKYIGMLKKNKKKKYHSLYREMMAKTEDTILTHHSTHLFLPKCTTDIRTGASNTY